MESVQTTGADHHTIFIRVKPFTWSECDAAKRDGNVAVADVFLNTLLRVGIECPNPHVDTVDVSRVADAAIHHNAFPAIFLRQDGELVTHQCTTQATATVDDQNLPFPIFCKRRAD